MRRTDLFDINQSNCSIVFFLLKQITYIEYNLYSIYIHLQRVFAFQALAA